MPLEYMSSEDMIQVLQRTKNRLFEKGWRKDGYGNEKGPNCIVGALSYCSSRMNIWEPLAPVENYLGNFVEDGNIVTFNDDQGTTFDDIIDLLDLAIKNLENE